MAGRGKQSADKTKAKVGRLKLKKQTVRDLTQFVQDDLVSPDGRSKHANGVHGQGALHQ